MSKKTVVGLISVTIIIVAFYGIKLYTNSYKNDLNKVIEDTEQNEKIKQEENEKLDKEKEGEKEAGEIDYNKDNNFTLADLDENTISLSDYKGKKVFLNFWASWCSPCRSEMPDMDTLYENIKDSDTVMLAVNIGEDKDDVKKFIDNNEFQFKVLLDTKTKVGEQYSVSGIPTSFLIDENGNIVRSITGAMSLKQMQEFIR
ncbi:TlpA disulfide reductase family protein [Clostridium aestuarii]|uniref:TlpA disulfide reductase family protein n=1 Tax=Clostridium aestuarii TaxID=338193 RepID=A0ABT4D5V2_9CLOT|nr:TlpA disulfide reductase family protein [Clostridium aestuarii]MCY6485560.1 TlpA disulfide reductase family protein [Clostridium aestuarii]